MNEQIYGGRKGQSPDNTGNRDADDKSSEFSKASCWNRSKMRSLKSKVVDVESV